MSAAHRLSNLQQELLKLYAADVSEEDLLHIKHYLAKYFASKAIGEAVEEEEAIELTAQQKEALDIELAATSANSGYLQRWDDVKQRFNKP
jgi:hypothetical protein